MDMRLFPSPPTAVGGLGREALVATQRQPVLRKFLADLVERGHAEVLRLQQFVRAALDQVAEGVDAQPVHALACPHRQVQLRDGLVENGLFLLADGLPRPETIIELSALLQRSGPLMLKGSDRGHENDYAWTSPEPWTNDVEELFAAEIASETAFRDHEIGQTQCALSG